MTEEEQALIEDGRRWRRFWSPDMQQIYVSAVVRHIAEAQKAGSVGASLVAIAYDMSGNPAFGELLRRRAELGPLAGKCGRDRAAMRRWVATGCSELRTEAA